MITGIEHPTRDGRSARSQRRRIRKLIGWSASLSLGEAIKSALAWSAKRREVLGYE